MRTPPSNSQRAASIFHARLFRDEWPFVSPPPSLIHNFQIAPAPISIIQNIWEKYIEKVNSVISNPENGFKMVGAREKRPGRNLHIGGKTWISLAEKKLKQILGFEKKQDGYRLNLNYLSGLKIFTIYSYQN